MIRKVLVFIFLFFISAFMLFADDYKTLLEEVDSLASFMDSDFSAKYTIVQEIPGEGRKTTVAAVFRRDNKKIYSIIIMEPAETKGQGYLKQDKTLWFYDPESRVYNSTSSKERFQNSNARNSDFTMSTLSQDYEIVASGKEKLGQYNCIILFLEANNDEVTYPIMKIWISEDKLVRKTEDYSLSNQLLRTTLFPSYQKKGNKQIPFKVLMIDNLEGAAINGKFENEKTQLTIENPSLDDLPDIVFSKSFLEKMGD